MVTVSVPISYDWLIDAIQSVCRPAFDDETLRIVSLHPRVQRISAHHEFDCRVMVSESELPLILRLYHGRFSHWSGTDSMKPTREFSALRHAYQHGMPVLFPYAHSHSLHPFGRPYLVTHSTDGHYWWELGTGFARAQEHAVDEMAQALAHLHRNVPAEHPLIPNVFVSDVVESIENRILLCGTAELRNRIHACRRRLEEQEPLPTVMLHGRYTLDAVVLRNDSVRAITHWENAALGDPRWDVATTSLSFQVLGSRSLGHRFVAGYVQETGIPMDDLAVWEGLVALRSYVHCLWLRSMDPKTFESIAGRQTDLLDHEDFYYDRMMRIFG